MDPQAAAREFLRQAPGEAFCSACLALTCSTSLTDMWQITAALLREAPEFSSGPATCTSCRRMTATLAYTPPTKCAHCSRSIGDDGLGIVMGGDHFHRSCWKVLLSDERVRISRSLSRQSRELIERARDQLHRPPAPAPD